MTKELRTAALAELMEALLLSMMRRKLADGVVHKSAHQVLRDESAGDVSVRVVER